MQIVISDNQFSELGPCSFGPTQDPRNMSQACLDIIANKEIIALSARSTNLALQPACLKSNGFGARRSRPTGNTCQARLPVAGPKMAQLKLGPTVEHMAAKPRPPGP